jgi:hypothetical protein
MIICAVRSQFLIAGTSGSVPVATHVKLLVGELALGQVFLKIFRFSTVSHHFTCASYLQFSPPSHSISSSCRSATGPKVYDGPDQSACYHILSF